MKTGLTRRAAAVGLAGVVALAGAVALGGPAAGAGAGAAEVTVTSDLGVGLASDDGPTTLDVVGTGFQVVQGGFGGVYVAFGWISGPEWVPSGGGQSGEDFLYIADGMTADTNTGALRFISFPGSSTADEAQGVLADDGSFETTLVVPGPVLQLSDAGGEGREVDCRVDVCGVLTFGAHALANANNETFTPVQFVAPGAGGGGESASPEASEAASEAAETASAATEEPSETATLDASAEASAAEEVEAGAEDAEAGADVEDGAGVSSATPWLIGGAVALLGILAAVLGATRKRKDS